MSASCEDITCPDDDCFLADVVLPDPATLKPKEYTEAARSQWAAEMAAEYPDGVDVYREDPLLERHVAEFDRHGQNGAALWVMLERGTPLWECCRILGLDQTALGKFLSRPSEGYTAGQFFLLEEMVLSGEPYHLADIVSATGIKTPLARRLVNAIGPRHEWLTPEGAQLTYTYATRDAILKALDEGTPMTELAERHDLPYTTVVKLVRTHR